MEQSFVLGLGAQKSGTTWLYDYLQGRPDVDLGFRKEYHVFDALTTDEFQPLYWRHLAGAPIGLARSALHAARLGAAPASSARERLRAAGFMVRPQLYYDYFAQLLRRQPQVRLTGDITPSYNLLSAAVLRDIRDNFEARGVQARALFLMRDPVERLWSSVRMTRRHGRFRNRTLDPALLAMPETEHVTRVFEEDYYRRLGNYEEAITNSEAAFGREGLVLGFYERLFGEEEMSRICGALGLDLAAMMPDFGRRRNVSEKKQQLDEALTRRIARAYADEYRFVAARFGYDAVMAIWPNLRFVD